MLIGGLSFLANRDRPCPGRPLGATFIYVNYFKHLPEFSSGTNVTNMLSSDKK